MLADLLAPISTEKFFAEFWTKQFTHIPGPPEKLAHLFPWGVLNRVLEQHRFTAHRLDLVKAGQHVDPARYLDRERVDASGLTNELENGATLIFNFCEEAHPPLRELCTSLERLFHVDVYANLYAGWHKDNGFEVHWDDQDNLILQVAGRKYWKVWAPTRLCPFKQDIVDTSPKTKPDGPPSWEGVLEQGGVLNMPRGWWHVAYPMEEPCLHLTVTIKNLHGIGLLNWFAHQMKASQAVRMALPIVASEDERRAWLDSVWKDVQAAWGPDILDRYLAHVDGRAKPRSLLRLPDVASACAAVGRSTPVQLALPRPLTFQTSGASARFVARDTDWETSSELVPSLDRFNDGLPHTIAELSPDGSAKLAPLLTALVMKGVLRRADL
jgi:ribosomal protein L16 Arg81 hydroxylase